MNATDIILPGARVARATSTLAAALFFAALTLPVAIGFLVVPGTAHFAVSVGQFMTFWTVFSVVLAIASPFAGRAMDRFGVRLVVVVSGLILTASLVGVAIAPSFLVFMSMGVLFGIGQSGCTVLAASVIITRWHPASRRGRMLGLAGMGSALGTAAWGLVLPAATNSGGFIGGALACAVAAFAFTSLPGILLLRNPPHAADEQATQHTANRRLVLAGYVGVTVLIMLTAVLFAFETAYGNVQAAVLQTFGLDATAAGLVVTLYAVCGLLAKPVLGFLHDKLGVGVLFAALGLLFLLGLPVMALVSGWGIAGVLLVMPIASLSMAVPTVTLPLIIGKAVGQQRFSVAYGLVYGAFALTLGFVIPVWGVFYDHTGSYFIPLVLAGVLGLLGVGILLVAYRLGTARQSTEVRTEAEAGVSGRKVWIES